ncbi:MAG TPA: ribosome biogenesis GTPase YlqF [Clostridiaceae bacterium]|nr:ribosome biogenesis GTPase YlqF [Clostridiaceae bacterium]
MAKINWFPGHMAKSLKELKNSISACDYVIETCDARLPLSSRNPQLNKALQKNQNKKYMLLLTKSDLADPIQTAKWIDFYSQQNIQNLVSVMAINSLDKTEVNKIRTRVLADNQDIINRAKSRGRRIKPIRIMINGIPNTGKSTLINSLIGKRSAQVSNRPGVTRSLNWLRAGTEFELLDTPGILMPKLATVAEQIKLGISGAIKDDILPLIEVACGLVLILAQQYPQAFVDLYKIELNDDADYSTWLTSHKLLEKIALELNMIKTGGVPDLERTARRLLTEYRQGKLGRFSLESPDQAIVFPASL